MRIVGKTPLDPGIGRLDVENLLALDRLMHSLRHLGGGPRHFFPKGVYRYRTHEEADAAWRLAVARDMAELMAERDHGTR